MWRKQQKKVPTQLFSPTTISSPQVILVLRKFQLYFHFLPSLPFFHFSFFTLDHHFFFHFPLLFPHCDFLFLSRHAQWNDVFLIHLEREWVRHKRQTTTLTCSQFYHIVIINGLPFHRHEITSTSETVLWESFSKEEREREFLKGREREWVSESTNLCQKTVLSLSVHFLTLSCLPVT